MNLESTKLEMIEQLAGLFYTPREIAIILEVDPEDLDNEIASENGEIYTAYMKGYYKSDVELRKSITESALQGSSPAAGHAKRYSKNFKDQIMRKALEDQDFENIKSYLLEGNEAALPAHQKLMLDRWVAASKLLDKNPVMKNAVAILRLKFPGLSRTQAYEDCRNAIRMFNSKKTSILTCGVTGYSRT